MSDRLDDLLLRYKMAHNIAFNEIDPHSPKHKGNGMSKVFKRSKEIEAESLQEIRSYIDTKIIEGRVDELHRQYGGQLDSYAEDHYYPKRIKELEAELKLKGEK